MAIKGSLAEASLADVVQLLALGMKSGCLSVADRSRLGQIYFERGRVTFARIVNRRDRLGDLLVRDGVVAADRIEAVLAEQDRNPDSRLGELLVERGIITADQRDRYIALQIEEAVFHLFTWSRGTFFFEAGERPEGRETTVSINPDSLLLEAARRVDEWSQIEKKIPSLDLIFTLDRERLAGARVDLTPEQERIVPLLDGTRSVQQIVDETGLTEFDAGREIFGLIQAGFARSEGRLEEDDSRARDDELTERRNLAAAFYRTGMFDDAAREFMRLLEMNPRDAFARFHLALIQIRERRFSEAVDELKRLLELNGPGFGAFMNLALALRMAGRQADARLALEAAGSHRPESALPVLQQALARLSARNVADARRQFQEYRRRMREERPAAAWFYFAGLAEALAGDLAAAEALAREGLGLYPRSAPLFLLGGLINERRGDAETAEKLYRRALEMDATLPQVQKNLGDLAYRRGAWDEALPFYQRASELDPDLGEDLWIKLGNLHYKQRNREGAIRCWSRALEFNPANQLVRNNLEIVTHAAG